MDLIIRVVPDYGFLPIIKDEDGNQLYRGEYQETTEGALHKICDRIEEMADEAPNKVVRVESKCCGADVLVVDDGYECEHCGQRVTTWRKK